MKRMRRYLVAGILVWLPVGVTFVLIKFLASQVDKILSIIPDAYHPANLVGFNIPGLWGFILAFLILLATGILAANFVGRGIVNFWESLLERIPVIRSIYAAVKKFAEVVFSDTSQSFKKVLLIEYPRKGLYSLAFQTSSQLGEVQGRTGEDVVCSFVPTTPNPTSGFIIIIPRKDVIELDMSVDEALKMIMSLGVVVPTWRRDQVAELRWKLPPDPPVTDGGNKQK